MLYEAYMYRVDKLLHKPAVIALLFASLTSIITNFPFLCFPALFFKGFFNVRKIDKDSKIPNWRVSKVQLILMLRKFQGTRALF